MLKIVILIFIFILSQVVYAAENDQTGTLGIYSVEFGSDGDISDSNEMLSFEDFSVADFLVKIEHKDNIVVDGWILIISFCNDELAFCHELYRENLPKFDGRYETKEFNIYLEESGDSLYPFPENSNMFLYYPGEYYFKFRIETGAESNIKDGSADVYNVPYDVYCVDFEDCETNLNSDLNPNNDALSFQCTSGMCVPFSSNPLPVANKDFFNIAKDSSSTVLDVLNNDVDPEGNGLSIISAEQPNFGSISPNMNEISYVPNPGFFGSDSFEYTIRDSNNLETKGIVYINVYNNDDLISESFESYSVLNGQLLGKVSGNTNKEDLYFYQLDLIGNVRSEFNEFGPINFADFLPYGSSITDLAGSIGYKSSMYDKFLGFYGTYMPEIGRYFSYTSSDLSFLNSQEFNAYSYNLNNPYRDVGYESQLMDLSIPEGQNGVEGKSVTGGQTVPQVMRLVPPKIATPIFPVDAILSIGSAAISVMNANFLEEGTPRSIELLEMPEMETKTHVTFDVVSKDLDVAYTVGFTHADSDQVRAEYLAAGFEEVQGENGWSYFTSDKDATTQINAEYLLNDDTIKTYEMNDVGKFAVSSNPKNIGKVLEINGLDGKIQGTSALISNMIRMDLANKIDIFVPRISFSWGNK
ncbi:cadherin-like domain-containing protein [Candidatus Woesearchaeota archaeon]|nr:cadherin-like domain-containing protein [Candidatus Woesearchaeota archaeon]